MCQKQCRDENGFKCHTTSESHLRQMRVFSDNPHKVLDEYSAEFEKDFLAVLSQRHGTKRVRATAVYNEFIAHKQHVHMNSTKWVTLTGFVQYLGKEGICVVDETEKGWYIAWIDRDPRLLAMQEKSDKRKKAEKDDEERLRRTIEKQVQAAKELASEEGDDKSGPSELKREDGQAVKLAVVAPGKQKQRGTGAAGPAAKKPRVSFGDDDAGDGGEKGGKSSSWSTSAKTKVKPLSAMESLMWEEERKKENAAKAKKKKDTEAEASAERRDYWLEPGIIVKVMNKNVGDGKFYKKKACVRKVIERYVGEVKMIGTGEKLRVDQDQLETVIPKVGGFVVILNGRGRGSTGELKALDTDAFNASVKVIDGELAGQVLTKEYEDISKLDKD
ncbi:unnamed protein product [Chrysoparadoxa australica]